MRALFQIEEAPYTGHVGEQAIVIYADVLGFSDLVMSMEDCIDLLDGFHYAMMSRAQLRQFVLRFLNDTRPVTWLWLSKKGHRSVPRRVAASQHTASVFAEWQHGPGSDAERAGKMGLHCICFAHVIPGSRGLEFSVERNDNRGTIIRTVILVRDHLQRVILTGVCICVRLREETLGDGAIVPIPGEWNPWLARVGPADLNNS